LSKIRAIDKVRKDQRRQVIESDIDGYRTLFVGGEGKPSILESAAKRADVVQYVLVLLGDLLEGKYPLLFEHNLLINCLQTTQFWVKHSLSTPILIRRTCPYSSNLLTPKAQSLSSPLPSLQA
jgi:hypothetical protein